MFGKEGKRADYTPYSCMKVILSNAPGQGDHHGESEEAIKCVTKHRAAVQVQERDQTGGTKQRRKEEERKNFQSNVEGLTSRTSKMHQLKASIQDKVLFQSV